jgi:CubicO group peptidase (beta-lactamase class C family)
MKRYAMIKYFHAPLALIFMLLMEEGKLALADKISKYFPDARDTDPQSERQILWRLSSGTSLQTLGHDNRTCDQRSRHHSQSSGRLSPRQWSTQESKLGVAIVEYDR